MADLGSIEAEAAWEASLRTLSTESGLYATEIPWDDAAFGEGVTAILTPSLQGWMLCIEGDEDGGFILCHRSWSFEDAVSEAEKYLARK